MKGTILTVLSLITCTVCCKNGQLIASGVSESTKAEIVDYHNQLRSKVATGSVPNQPAAKNMLQMKWDEEIAKKAQNWADNCVFQHDSSQDRNVSRFQVGQNLGILYTSNNVGKEPKFKQSIDLWFEEHNYYTFGTIQGSKLKKQRKQTGHYTQVAWANTYYVGCGYTHYLEDKWYTKLYVCNYGPAGNYIGEYPYESGQPSCSNYSYKSSNDYSGLCRNN